MAISLFMLFCFVTGACHSTVSTVTAVRGFALLFIFQNDKKSRNGNCENNGSCRNRSDIEQHPKPSYGDRKCRTDFRIRIYDQGRQGVPTLCRLFLYSQQLCKNIPSTAEAPKPDGEQENQYTAHNPEAANNNCTWKSNPSASAFARTMLRFIWHSRTIECGIATPAACTSL